MNDYELNEDIHQYPIKMNSGITSSEQDRKKIASNEITVVLPIFNPQADAMNNIRLAINKFLDLKLKIIILEQTKDQYSYLFKFIENIAIARSTSLKWLSIEQYISDSDKFLKNTAINWLVKNKVFTKYVWIHDPNFYVKFPDILKKLHSLNSPDFIYPCSSCEKLSKEDSVKILSKNDENVILQSSSVGQDNTQSFLANREKLIEIGGLIEDDENGSKFLSRMKAYGYDIHMLDNHGAWLHNDPRISPVPRMTFTNVEFERDMAIIICHFNWCKYINPTRNLHRFLREMEMDDLPVYGVELSLDDNFETKDRKNWINIKVDQQNICFQKEACINLVEKHIPKKYKKVAWIDPDLHFSNRNWYRETSEKLETHKLVQMYSEGYGTDRRGRISRRHPSIMAMYGIVPMDHWFHHPGHPGGAWGARRDFWEYGGLYPYCIMGGGDTVFIYTLFGHKFSNDVYTALGLCGDKLFEPYVEWRSKISKYAKPEEITYVNNSFVHEWHGDRVKRNYNLRHHLLKNINIFKNVRLNDTGLVELYDIRFKSTYASILGYFKERDEDGVIGDMEAFLEFRTKQNEKEA